MKTDLPILDLIDEFLENIDIRDASRRRYRENLKVFVVWMTKNSPDVRQPRRAEIINYKEYLIKSGKALTTIDTYMTPVRGFFKWLESEGIYENVAAGVHSPKRYHGYRKTYLQAQQVMQLLAAIDRSTIVGKRNFAIINLMVRTGLRCVEVSRMNWHDILVRKKGYTLLIQGKGRLIKDRELNVTDDIMTPIFEYHIERREAEGIDHPLFVNHSYYMKEERISRLTISKIIKKYFRMINIDDKKMTAHSLRHTAAINAIKAGAKIPEVQSMLGHVNSQSTDIYLRALEAESAEEGTAVRLLENYYRNTIKQPKIRQKLSKNKAECNL
jgi:integrase/recombinase XerC/integrase/recombinase XerD